LNEYGFIRALTRLLLSEAIPRARIGLWFYNPYQSYQFKATTRRASKEVEKDDRLHDIEAASLAVVLRNIVWSPRANDHGADKSDSSIVSRVCAFVVP
jgi:hypothetical protein